MQPETRCASFVDIAMAIDVEKRQATVVWMVEDITHARDVCMDPDSLWRKHED